jgi:hypothetical protein
MFCKWIAKILFIQQIFLYHGKDYIIYGIYVNKFMLIVPVIVV